MVHAWRNILGYRSKDSWDCYSKESNKFRIISNIPLGSLLLLLGMMLLIMVIFVAYLDWEAWFGPRVP